MVGAGVFGWGLVICAISTFCGVWYGAVFQCRNFKEKSAARPFKRKPFGRGNGPARQSRGLALGKGEAELTPSAELEGIRKI